MTKKMNFLGIILEIVQGQNLPKLLSDFQELKIQANTDNLPLKNTPVDNSVDDGPTGANRNLNDPFNNAFNRYMHHLLHKSLHGDMDELLHRNFHDPLNNSLIWNLHHSLLQASSSTNERAFQKEACFQSLDHRAAPLESGKMKELV